MDFYSSSFQAIIGNWKTSEKQIKQSGLEKASESQTKFGYETLNEF